MTSGMHIHPVRQADSLFTGKSANIIPVIYASINRLIEGLTEGLRAMSLNDDETGIDVNMTSLEDDGRNGLHDSEQSNVYLNGPLLPPVQLNGLAQHLIRPDATTFFADHCDEI